MTPHPTTDGGVCFPDRPETSCDVHREQLQTPPGTHISCCVCLNRGKRVSAVSVVKGYAVCSEHVDLVAKPGFDIFRLRPAGRVV